MSTPNTVSRKQLFTIASLHLMIKNTINQVTEVGAVEDKIISNQIAKKLTEKGVIHE